jgi:hypothetical protein
MRDVDKFDFPDGDKLHKHMKEAAFMILNELRQSNDLGENQLHASVKLNGNESVVQISRMDVATKQQEFEFQITELNSDKNELKKKLSE